MSLIENVSRYLSFNESELLSFAQKAPTTYRTYQIPKKNGRLRTIHHPAKETKSLQYALINLIFKNYPIHSSAVAYRKGVKSPLKLNAESHSKYLYTIKMDFKDFFHSIVFEDLKNILDSPYTQQELEFLKNVLFLNYQGIYCLAIGAPSSPILSNIVMHGYDESILKIVTKIDPDATYTRYADDITFSSNKKSHCLNFAKELNKLTKDKLTPSLKLNSKKTILLSKANHRMVTGLVITPQGNVSVGRHNKKYIKKLLNDLKYDKISPIAFKYLKGYFAFVRDVEPKFVNSLTNKYGAALINKIII